MTAPEPQAPDPSRPTPPGRPGRLPHSPGPQGPLGLLDRLDDAALPLAGRVLARCVDLADAARDVRVRPRHTTEPRANSPASGSPADGARSAGALVAGTAAAPGAGDSAAASVVRSTLRVLVLGLFVLIVVGAVTTMLRGADPGQGSSGPPGPGPGDAPSGPVTPTTVVGPAAGDDAASYAAAARAKLDALAAAAPQADIYAVVSLAEYRTPEDLRRLFASYRISEVFFRVPPDAPVLSTPVRDPVADIDAAFDSAADAAETRAHDGGAGLGAGADAAQPGTTGQPVANQQAQALRARCACLFGVVLRAPAARVLGLAENSLARVVDPAPPGLALPAIRFVPLEPERS